MLNAKRPGESLVDATYLLMPHQANPAGTAFGGAILSWIDMTACMAAQRHCQMQVVTASIDTVSFRAPINVGDHVILKARLSYVGTSSMEISVTVIKEDPYSGQKTEATRAYVTCVALDANNRPADVPRLLVETEEEKNEHEQACRRVAARKESRGK
ncbi:MAG: acyl-CoA thioesterase [Planctomycetota bacterium]